MRDTRKLSRREAHDFWRGPPGSNAPHHYLNRPGFQAIVRYLEKYVPKDAKVLEIGCSVGTTLDAVWTAGYKNLTGIEINPASVELLEQKYPDMAQDAHVLIGPVEEYIKLLGAFDVIYSKAVLCHVHTSSDWIFGEMAARARYIITVEDENTRSSGRHFPRNYRRVFAPFGFRQVEFTHHPHGMNEAYHGRMMVKR